MRDFLTARCRALEAAQSNKFLQRTQGIGFGQHSGKLQIPSHKKSQSQLTTHRHSRCPKCKGIHLYSCEQFRRLNVADMKKFALDVKLCFNCLRSGHMVKDCSSHNIRYAENVVGYKTHYCIMKLSLKVALRKKIEADHPSKHSSDFNYQQQPSTTSNSTHKHVRQTR